MDSVKGNTNAHYAFPISFFKKAIVIKYIIVRVVIQLYSLEPLCCIIKHTKDLAQQQKCIFIHVLCVSSLCFCSKHSMPQQWSDTWGVSSWALAAKDLAPHCQVRANLICWWKRKVRDSICLFAPNKLFFSFISRMSLIPIYCALFSLRGTFWSWLLPEHGWRSRPSV